LDKQTIILIWKFEKPFDDNIEFSNKNSVNFYDVEVEKNLKKKLLIIKMNTEESEKEYTPKLQFINDYLLHNEEDKIILIHDKPRINTVTLEKYFIKNIYSLFGGGSGSGHDLIYNKLVDTVCLTLESSAIIENKLKEKIFDNIWKYYSLQNLKKKLYELKEDLLTVLYPHSFDNENFKLADSLKLGRNNISLEDRIKNFINESNNNLTDENFKFDKWFETLKEDRYKDKYNILNSKLTELVNNQETCLSTKDVTSLNQDFNNLISSFKCISIY